MQMGSGYRTAATPAVEAVRSGEPKLRARKRPKGAPTHVRSWPLRPAERRRRLAEHRKTLHGALANRLFAHGVDIACEKLNSVAWQKNFPRSVCDRAPGLLVEIMRRRAESAGGDRLYEYNPNTTALSQTCLCGNRKKKLLSQRVHRCECGIIQDRDVFSAYLGLHVRARVDGCDRLDLQAADQGWPHRHDVDEPPRSKATMRRSRSARTSTADQHTALLAA
jgi:hypothetical protein